MISGARHMRPLNEKCLFPSSSSALLAHVRQCMEGGRERERESLQSDEEDDFLEQEESQNISPSS